MKKGLELYIHIPFCVKKCAYCDFLSAPADENVRQEYVEALCLEIGGYCNHYHDIYEVDSIFLGGGTPSILAGGQVRQIFKAMRDSFAISPQAEITIEANPGTVMPEKLSAWREVGINRVSIGLQSANDKELKLLGRIHTYEQFEETYENVRKAGFSNVNVDLISAIPGQSVESWRCTLERVAKLAPEHISAYSLIVEEGTPFYEYFGENSDESTEDYFRECSGEERLALMPGFPETVKDEDGGHARHVMPALPDEEEEREMYHLTERVLSSYGYQRYEISNYAKEGYACRHNLGYWERREYLGIGLGAASFIDHVRYKNTPNLGRYLEIMQKRMALPLVEEAENLAVADEMAEFMFLGLRKTRGISAADFAKSFGREIKEVYKRPLKKLVDGGLLKMDGERIFLTGRGIDVSNMVFVEFLEPEL